MNNTMLRRVMCLLWLCLSYLPAHAQTETPSSTMDSLPTRYKWEVATDLLWLIDKHTMPATSVFIRRHTEKGAWRLRVGASYNRRFWEFIDDPNQTPVNYKYVDDEKNTLFLVRFGYQWHKTLPKALLYYGGDVNFTYKRFDANNYRTDSNHQIFYEVTKAPTYQLGGIFFLGVQKYISKHFSLSGEVAVSVFYEHTKFRKNIFEYPEDKPTTPSVGYSDEGKFGASIMPLYTFNIGYHF